MRRIFCLAVSFSFLLVFIPCQSSDAAPNEVAEILKAAAAYCQKLENTALNFVCLEEITEKINFSKDIALVYRWGVRPSVGWARRPVPRERVTNVYVYDFQFIRKDGQIKESRTLLEENKKKKNEKDASLKTLSFNFRNVINGPVGILGRHWQPFYEYEIVGEDELNGLPAIILDIVPKPDYETEFLFGKVWLNKDTLDILKIEWSPQRIGNFAIFESRGQRYKLEPRITLISEFQVEKNGIRFPSRFFIEEAYVNKKGKKFIRSETTVLYKDFRFFTVEVDIKY